MAQERIIPMPSNDYALFQKLQVEVGEIRILQVSLAQDTGQWYNNPDLESSGMAVRAIVRTAILEQLGYKVDGSILKEEDLAQKAGVNPEALSILGDPNYIHYKWQDVSLKNFGSFADMGIGNGPLIDAKRGIVLFTDEVQKLLKGESVTTFHSSGLQWMGFLVERKDVYKIVNGDLQRVLGLIMD